MELTPWRSSSGTTQFPAITASPNVAACRTPIGRSSRSRSNQSPACPMRGRPEATSVGMAARIASSAALQYAARQLVASVRGRHHHQREPAARHRRAAVEALQRRACRRRPGRGRDLRRMPRPSRFRRRHGRRSASSKPSSRSSSAVARRPRQRSPRAAMRCEPNRSAPRPAGSCTARCVTNSAVVRRPTAASETP